MGYTFRAVESANDFDRMSRGELVEHLEWRGFACYDDESTSLLRETAKEDYFEESK